MLPDDPRHGTYAGANQHWSDGEKTCDECQRAATLYRKRVNLDHVRGKRRKMSPVGAKRRVQALQCLGWSLRALSRESGLSVEVLLKMGTRDGGIFTSTFTAVSMMYDRLSMTYPPERTVGERSGAVRARRSAARLGYVPPLAWDCIDDPDEQPTDWRYVPPTRAELLGELDEQGANLSEVCTALGINRAALQKWLERQDQWEVYKRLRDRERPTEGAA